MANITQIQIKDVTYDIKDNISGYQTASDVASAITVKQDKLVSGTNIKTINNQSVLGSGNIAIEEPVVNDGVLTIKKNSTSVGTFSANQSGNTEVNIAVPTKVSELTNDSNYVTTSTLTGSYRTSSAQDTIDATKQPKLTPSTGINITNNVISVSSDVAMVSDIPTKTSELTNDGEGTSKFATEQDLTNYYKKTEVYSKTEIDSLLANLLQVNN